MIDLKQLSVDLSYKIGDPVSDTVVNGSISKYAWETDGRLFTSIDRLRFINQGISKLYMYLLNLKRGHRPKFVEVMAVEELFLGTNDGAVQLDKEVQRKGSGDKFNLFFKDIKEIFITYKTTDLVNDVTVKAEQVEAEQYASIYHGNNTLYKPSFKEKRIYWALLGNTIRLLPYSTDTTNDFYKSLMLVYTPDITNLTYDDTSNYITQDYYLMVLILSALEAMVDLNNQAKFQLLTAELTSLFQLLGQVTQLEEAKDGK